MGCIDSDKANPGIWLVHIVKRWVGIIRIIWSWCEIWIHVRIERIVIVECHFTKNHKQKEKSNNKQKEKKNQNQANRRVDLDLDEMSLGADVYSNFIRAWVV